MNAKKKPDPEPGSCPSCGSENTTRTGPADPPMLAMENLDEDLAGYYTCNVCDEVFAWEALLEVWDIAAQCPHCGGRKTRRTSGRRTNGYAYHHCSDCERAFRSKLPGC